MSSAMKLITPGVIDAIKSIDKGTWKGGNIVGPVGLAPYHDWDSKIPQAVKDKIKQVDKGLKDGSIKTNVTL
jgi:basic membrane protein A